MRLKVLFFFLILAGSLRADNFLLSTENTSMLLTATVKETFGITIPYWKDSLKKCMLELETQQ